MEQHILGLHSRQRFLAGVDSELRSATRNKRFAIRNRSVWSMILDHREMLVSDLASMARATYGEDGFLGRLQTCAGSLFRRRRGCSPDEPDFSGRMLDALHSNAFTRLFPACVQRHATVSDFDGLESWYFNLARPIASAREPNHAARLETTATSSTLDLTGLEAFIEATERMINDLRLVSLGSTVGFHAGSDVAEHEAQVELVDMVLHGSLARAAQLVGRRSREAHYAALHLSHEQSPAGSESLFNDQDAWTRLAQPGAGG